METLRVGASLERLCKRERKREIDRPGAGIVMAAVARRALL